MSPCSLVDYAHKDKYTCVASTVGIILAVVSFIYFFYIYTVYKYQGENLQAHFSRCLHSLHSFLFIGVIMDYK